MVGDVLSTGVNGVKANLKDMQETAFKVAQNGSSQDLDIGDQAENMVDLIVEKRNIEANLKTIETADKVLGAIINVKA